MNNLSGSIFLLIWIALLTIASSLARAGTQVLFDNGQTQFQYGLELSQFEAADDFRVDVPSILRGVRFWTLEGYGIRDSALPFDGVVDYEILEGATSTSGDFVPTKNVVAEDLGNQIVRIDRGNITEWWGQLHAFEMQFELEDPIQVAGGKGFFLGLHLTNQYAQNGEFYWSNVAGPCLGAPSYTRDSGGDWQSSSGTVGCSYGGDRLAFQLIGSPAAVAIPPAIHTATLTCAIALLAIRFAKVLRANR